LLLLDLPSSHEDDESIAQVPVVSLTMLAGASEDQLSEIAGGWLLQEDFLYVYSLMCLPQNTDGYLRLRAAMTAHESYTVMDLMQNFKGLDVNVSGEICLAIAKREDPVKIIQKLAAKDMLAHLASAYILRWIISRYEKPETRREASVGKAVRAIVQWCKKHNIILGASQKNLAENLWPKYKSVCHFWAALYLVLQMGLDVQSEDGFLLFLTTAHALGLTGTLIVPHGGRKPLLSPDEIWLVPEEYLLRTDDAGNGQEGLAVIWPEGLDAHDIRLTECPPGLRPRPR
jgi:hypothetical protein